VWRESTVWVNVLMRREVGCERRTLAKGVQAAGVHSARTGKPRALQAVQVHDIAIAIAKSRVPEAISKHPAFTPPPHHTMFTGMLAMQLDCECDADG